MCTDVCNVVLMNDPKGTFNKQFCSTNQFKLTEISAFIVCNVGSSTFQCQL